MKIWHAIRDENTSNKNKLLKPITTPVSDELAVVEDERVDVAAVASEGQQGFVRDRLAASQRQRLQEPAAPQRDLLHHPRLGGSSFISHLYLFTQ